MSIERRAPTAMPTRSRSWENLVAHVDLGRGVQNAIELVERAIIALRKKHPAPA